MRASSVPLHASHSLRICRRRVHPRKTRRLIDSDCTSNSIKDFVIFIDVRCPIVYFVSVDTADFSQQSRPKVISQCSDLVLEILTVITYVFRHHFNDSVGAGLPGSLPLARFLQVCVTIRRAFQCTLRTETAASPDPRPGARPEIEFSNEILVSSCCGACCPPFFSCELLFPPRSRSPDDR